MKQTRRSIWLWLLGAVTLKAQSVCLVRTDDGNFKQAPCPPVLAWKDGKPLNGQCPVCGTMAEEFKRPNGGGRRSHVHRRVRNLLAYCRNPSALKLDLLAAIAATASSRKTVRTEQARDALRDWPLNSNFLKIKYGMIDAASELDQLSALQRDWDSYEADAPSSEAIRVSKEILATLATSLILPSTIVASAGGGVSIYFVEADRTAYIESYNDGTQALVLYDRHGEPEVLELGTDIPAADAGERISRYLDHTGR